MPLVVKPLVTCGYGSMNSQRPRGWRLADDPYVCWPPESILRESSSASTIRSQSNHEWLGLLHVDLRKQAIFKLHVNGKRWRKCVKIERTDPREGGGVNYQSTWKKLINTCICLIIRTIFIFYTFIFMYRKCLVWRYDKKTPPFCHSVGTY